MSEEEMDPLFGAVFRGDEEEVARILDAEPHLMDTIHEEQNLTALMLAAGEGRVGVVRLLLERGAEVDLDDDGITPLQIAAEHGHEDIVSVLLSYGADCSKSNSTGFTPLIMASFRGRVGVVRQLLQHMQCRGLDERNFYGSTAVWGACCNGRVEVLRVLLHAGADHTIASDDGQTPRDTALECRRRRCVALLQWWKNELERGYTLHRAKCLSDSAPVPQAPATASIPTYMAARSGPPPTLEVASLEQDSEGKVVDRDGEEEKDATLKYVLHDLARELYTELLEGFHK